MRFERLVVERFGRIRGLDTGPDPLPSLVAVVGPNEAGKSTFFQFLVSILYGFYPATKDTNPHTPWKEGEIEGVGHLRTDGGECVEVRRRLLSRPDGTLIRDGRSEDLRNRTVPFADHVPRKLFERIYALGLSELAGIDDESWSAVQDRLLGRMGADDVRPPLEVAAELEDEAGRLWRSTRRGDQRIRALDDRIRDLRRRQREAADRDRAMREKVRELEEARRARAEARTKRERLRLREERAARLAPARTQLRRIAELEERARDPEGLLEDLPADPSARRDGLREESSELEVRLRRLEERAAQLEAERDAFGPGERALLEDEERIASLAARATGSAGDLHSRIGELEQQIRDLERRCRSVVRELLDVPFEALDEDRIRSIPVRELRRRHARFRGLRRERRIREEASRMGAAPRGGASGPLLWGGGGALAAGIAMVAISLRAGQPAGVVAGVGLLALGLGAVVAGLRARALGPEEAGRDHAGEGEEEAGARRELDELLDDVPLRPAVREDPPDELAREVERLQELLDDRAERRSRLEDLRGDVAGLSDRLRRAGESLGIELPEEPAAGGHALSRALERARSARERARSAERELERVEEERRTLADRKAEVERKADDLDRRLERLGDGDPDAGIEEARHRIAARERADGLRRELERSHADLAELEERILAAEEEGVDLELDDEGRAGLRAEIDRLGERIETLSASVEGLEKTVEHGGEEAAVDEIGGEIRSLEEERERLVRERDRKHVLARVLRKADRTFREKHQPDVVRRAAEYLELVTDGRYDRVVLGDDAAEEADLRLREPATDRLIPVDEPVSTGTRQQVYLALRLAIVDHLDAGGERLPLFLDEAFVNWDAKRRERGFGLLRELAAERQIFLFTCHEPMARSLAERGARLIRLGGPR